MALDGKTRKVAAYSVKLALHCARKESDTFYSQQWLERWYGINHKVKYPGRPKSGDCSGFTGAWIPWASRVAVRGAPGVDVMNGQSWKAGYTGTMIEHGAQHRETTRTTHWHPGRTHCFYGELHGSVTHTAIFVGDVWLEAGTRWNGKILKRRLFVHDAVVSHGRTAGPEVWPFNYRHLIEARAYPV